MLEEIQALERRVRLNAREQGGAAPTEARRAIQSAVSRVRAGRWFEVID